VDIWVTSADGRDQKRLTANGNRNQQPYVSEHGRMIAFMTLRKDGDHIWRMDMDGGNARQLTFAAGFQISPAVTSDAKWIYFAHGASEFKLQKAHVVPVFDGYADWLRISPAGDLLAFWNVDK
jgi:TolB protein